MLSLSQVRCRTANCRTIASWCGRIASPTAGSTSSSIATGSQAWRRASRTRSSGPAWSIGVSPVADYEGLSPVERLLQQVGELNRKADGILRELQDIKDDNIRCHADRENLYTEVGKIKVRIGYYSG